MQWPALRRKATVTSGFSNPTRSRAARDSRPDGPGTLGVAAAQINLLVNTWLATADDGAASALGYAFR